MSDFPITADYAACVGAWGEKIENRSLLFDKFSLPKRWIADRPFKTNEAHRWSLLRICENGEAALSNDLEWAKQKANKGSYSQGTDQARQNVEILGKFRNSAATGKALTKERERHSRRFLQLLRQSHGERCHIVAAKLQSRLALNLAEGLVENGGASLDRLFGMPFIPGSAIKGVARHAALARIRALPQNSPERTSELEQYCRIFGTTTGEWDTRGSLHPFKEVTAEPQDRKGAVVFLPAYPLTEAPLQVDLTNVHTPDYYTGNKNSKLGPGNPRALRNESPRPNPFPAVAAGSVFGFSLLLNRHGFDAPELLRKAADLMEEALTVLGIGAKTGAGYGWFSVVSAEAYLDSNKEKAEAPASPASVSKTPTPDPRTVTMDGKEFAQKMLQLPELAEAEQRELLAQLTKDKLKKWGKSKKPSDQQRVEAIRTVATKLSINLP